MESTSSSAPLAPESPEFPSSITEVLNHAPEPYCAPWARYALLIIPYLELLAVLFYLSDNAGDRVRIVIWMILAVPFAVYVAKPFTEPMLPTDRRSINPGLVPARTLDWYPGQGFEPEYAEVVRVDHDYNRDDADNEGVNENEYEGEDENEGNYKYKETRRAVKLARGGWFVIHD